MMNKTFSLSELAAATALVAFVLSFGVVTIELWRSKKLVSSLRTDLRSQVTTNTYSISGRVLCQSSNFSVYAIDTETSFMHVVRARKRGDSLPAVECPSYVDGNKNIWVSHIVIVAILEEGKLNYYVAIAPGVSGVAVKQIESKDSNLPIMHGFGETGFYDGPLEIQFEESSILQVELVQKGNTIVQIED